VLSKRICYQCHKVYHHYWNHHDDKLWGEGRVKCKFMGMPEDAPRCFGDWKKVSYWCSNCEISVQCSRYKDKIVFTRYSPPAKCPFRLEQLLDLQNE